MNMKLEQTTSPQPLEVKNPQQSSKPVAGHQRLNKFVGQWDMEGQQLAGPFGSSAKITAVETFEWLEGEFFLICRFDGRVGSATANCIEIIGHDASTESYPSHSYYDNGITREWSSHERNGVWVRTGDQEIEGQAMQVKCTTTFADSGNTRTDKWECSRDGLNWQTFWDVRATKSK